MKLDRTNLIFLIIGILIYPLGLWGARIPNNVLAKLGLQELMVLSGILAWIISVVSCCIMTTRLEDNKKDVIFWVGYILNFVFSIVPIMFIIYVLIMAKRYGNLV